MGRTLPAELDDRIESPEPSEVVTHQWAMLYSAEAMQTIKEIREHIGQLLAQQALDLARREGRYLVTEDDIWSIVDDLGMTIDLDSDEPS